MIQKKKLPEYICDTDSATKRQGIQRRWRDHLQETPVSSDHADKFSVKIRARCKRYTLSAVSFIFILYSAEKYFYSHFLKAERALSKVLSCFFWRDSSDDIAVFINYWSSIKKFGRNNRAYYFAFLFYLRNFFRQSSFDCIIL